MCGIAGFTTFRSRPADRNSIARSMMQALQHRGPDDEGSYLDDSITLVHRRLAIIDLPGGVQPMSDPTGRFQLVYNGELYNYRELREKLIEKGCSFRTESDTEVILQSLIKHGI